MSGERGRRLIAGLLAVVAVAGCRAAPSAAPRTPSPPPSSSPSPATLPRSGPTRPAGAAGPYRLTHVVDGDTIRVSIAGRSTSIRLIGIDTPETHDPRDPVQCFGREASARAALLLSGRQVYLEYDPTQGRLDRYRRTLAYVWLPDGRMLNWEMVAGGFAHEYTYAAPYRYQAAFVAAQADARRATRGLWSPRTCNGDTERLAGAGPAPFAMAPTAEPMPATPASPGAAPPRPDDVNCSHFSDWAQAKAWYDRYFPSYGDVAHLDVDGDGIPCTSLPGAP